MIPLFWLAAELDTEGSGDEPRQWDLGKSHHFRPAAARNEGQDVLVLRFGFSPVLCVRLTPVISDLALFLVFLSAALCLGEVKV